MSCDRRPTSLMSKAECRSTEHSHTCSSDDSVAVSRRREEAKPSVAERTILQLEYVKTNPVGLCQLLTAADSTEHHVMYQLSVTTI